jgi:hypothetical protein
LTPIVSGSFRLAADQLLSSQNDVRCSGLFLQALVIERDPSDLLAIGLKHPDSDLRAS